MVRDEGDGGMRGGKRGVGGWDWTMAMERRKLEGVMYVGGKRMG